MANGFTQVLSKTRIWRNLRTAVFGGDILSAFANLTIRAVVEAFEYFSFHPQLVAAFIFELQNLDCTAKLGNRL